MKLSLIAVSVFAASFSAQPLAAAPAGIATQKPADVVVPPATPAAYNAKPNDWIVPPHTPLDWIVPPHKTAAPPRGGLDWIVPPH